MGTAFCLFAAWRVGADLIGAHLLGRGRCPVGGGERDGARRGEAWSVGVGLGAVTAVLALCVHRAFDFGARIPANGFLAAACLGIATVALHTRFAGAGGRLLTAVRVLPLGGGRIMPAIVRAVCVVLVLACLPAIVRAPLVDSSLEATGVPASVRVERALALAPADAEARWARARLRVASARRIWESGQTEDGRVLPTWAERRREALPSSRAPCSTSPPPSAPGHSDPFLHDALGWAHAGAAAIDEAAPAARQAARHRAAPGDRAATRTIPISTARLAALALGQREPLLRLRSARPRARSHATRRCCRSGRPLRAARARRRAVGASGADTADDRLEMGACLTRPASAARQRRVPPRAVALASPGRPGAARHALARSLAAAGRFRFSARRARHRAAARSCQSGASPGAWNVLAARQGPGGARRDPAASGAPRRAPPPPSSMRRSSATQARGRGHSLSARSVG